VRCIARCNEFSSRSLRQGKRAAEADAQARVADAEADI
jgi:hypothetical protein